MFLDLVCLFVPTVGWLVGRGCGPPDDWRGVGDGGGSGGHLRGQLEEGIGLPLGGFLKDTDCGVR